MARPPRSSSCPDAAPSRAARRRVAKNVAHNGDMPAAARARIPPRARAVGRPDVPGRCTAPRISAAHAEPAACRRWCRDRRKRTRRARQPDGSGRTRCLCVAGPVVAARIRPSTARAARLVDRVRHRRRSPPTRVAVIVDAFCGVLSHRLDGVRWAPTASARRRSRRRGVPGAKRRCGQRRWLGHRRRRGALAASPYGRCEIEDPRLALSEQRRRSFEPHAEDAGALPRGPALLA